MGARALGCLVAVAALVATSIGRRHRRTGVRAAESFATHVVGINEWVPVNRVATAPWSWLVAAPAQPGAVLEVAHDATRDQIEQLRRAFKDSGRHGEIVIQRACPPLSWLGNVARGCSG